MGKPPAGLWDGEADSSKEQKGLTRQQSPPVEVASLAAHFPKEYWVKLGGPLHLNMAISMYKNYAMIEALL